jgi:hypothetical protein
VAHLREALSGNTHAEAVEQIRKLTDRIVLTPVEDEHGHKTLPIDCPQGLDFMVENPAGIAVKLWLTTAGGHQEQAAQRSATFFVVSLAVTAH